MTTAEKIQLLRNLPGFQNAEESALVALVDNAQEFLFTSGQVIAREGQMGTGMYLILEGRVGVVRHGVQVDTSGPGEFIGELSPLNQTPRIATLTALEPVVCLGVASWLLDDLLKQPAIAERVRRDAQAHRDAEEQRRAAEARAGNQPA